MRGGTLLGHLPLPLQLLLAGCCRCNRSDDDCRFVAGATVIHTTVCHRPLGSARLTSRTLTDGWSAHSRTDGRESTRAEQMKNGLVPRWLFHWLRASSGIAARQIVVMATRRRRLPASLLLLLEVMDFHHESTFSTVTAHNFTDLNRRHDRICHPMPLNHPCCWNFIYTSLFTVNGSKSKKNEKIQKKVNRGPRCN